jgi:hypothetical protein
VSTLVWAVEWRLALSSTRDFVFWVVAPLAVVLVVGTDAVSAQATASWYTALFTAIGMLRTALPVMRDGERGMTARVIRGGVSPAGYLIQRTAAGATLTLVQLLPAVVVAGVFLQASVSDMLALVGALAISLWIAGLMGVLLAATSRTRTEALALCAVTLLLLLHMSGVFRVPSGGGLGEALEQASPFRALHESFVRMVSGGMPHGGAAELAWAIGVPALILAVASRLVESLARDG